ncbi:MAG: cyclic nucleotide-binding domain-containing protein [Actinomycetota bacterium]
MSKREVAERLKDVPLFRDCSSRQLRRIAGRGWERDYPAGSELCEEGKPGDDFFVILQGQADVTRRGKKVRTLGPGAHFGEIALLKLLGREPRSATVTARTLVRCFLLPKAAFRDVIYEANIATNLLYGLAAYMRDPV